MQDRRNWWSSTFGLHCKDETPYLLEINSIPGMTAESLVPDEVRHAGRDFGEFLEDLIKDAL